jgi:ABC-type antimicrobial peptide transport system permease subunit
MNGKPGLSAALYLCPHQNHLIMNRNALQIGLYGGITSIIFSLLTYLGGVEMMAKWWVSMLFFPITIAFLVWSGRSEKKSGGGYVTLKNAFIAVFTTGAVMSVIGVLFGILLYQVIDTELPEKMSEAVINNTISMMESFGVPDSEIDNAAKDMEVKMAEGFTVAGQLKSLIWALVTTAILSIIIAAIIKKNPPFGIASDETVIDNLN